MVMLWSCLGLIMWLVEPKLLKDILVTGLYLPFFLLFFPALFLTLAIILANSRRGLLIAIAVTIFLMLRIYQLGNLLNLLLIAGIVVAIGRYFDV